MLLKFLNFNIRGLNDLTKKSQVTTALNHITISADIIILTETHWNDSLETHYWVKSVFKNYIYTKYSSTKRGVAILSNNKNISFSDSIIDPNGRYIVTTINNNNKKYKIAAVYAPVKMNNEKIIFYEELYSLIKNESIDILIGDFNCISSHKDNSSGIVHSINALDPFTNKLLMSDVFSFRPSEQRFTHFKNDYGSRLDIMYPILLYLKCIY